MAEGEKRSRVTGKDNRKREIGEGEMDGQIKRLRGEDMGLVADWRLESNRRASITGGGYLVTMTVAREDGEEESTAIKQDAGGKGYIHRIDGSGKEGRNEK